MSLANTFIPASRNSSALIGDLHRAYSSSDTGISPNRYPPRQIFDKYSWYGTRGAARRISEADLILRAAPRVPYQEYLSNICRGGYRFGLIPVSDDEYARCKSPIKALEFLDAGMKVFASDIAPYRDFARDHPHQD